MPGSLHRQCLDLNERGGGRRHLGELTFPLSSVLQGELEHGQIFFWVCSVPSEEQVSGVAILQHLPGMGF